MDDGAKGDTLIIDLGFKSVPWGGGESGFAVFNPQELAIIVEKRCAALAAESAQCGFARAGSSAKKEALSVEGNGACVDDANAMRREGVQNCDLIAGIIEREGGGGSVSPGAPEQIAR